MGHTMQLDVPEDVYRSLRRTAKRSGQSLEELAAQRLVDATREFGSDPVEEFIGAFSSNVSHWADEHDKHLGKAIVAKMHGAEHRDDSDA